jgi:hypothetical protein
VPDRLRFWAGEEGPWDAELRLSAAPDGRQRVLLSLDLRPRLRRMAGEAWGLLLLDGHLPVCHPTPGAAGRALLAALAASRTPDALARLALAREIAGLLLPSAASPLEPWLIHRGRLRCLGSRRLPLPQGFLAGIFCRGTFGAWGLAEEGALGGTAGPSRPVSRHDRLRRIEAARMEAGRLAGPAAVRALDRALARAALSGA